MYNVHRILTKRVGVKWRKMWKRDETQRKQKWVFQLGLHRANELLIWERYTSSILKYLRWLLKHILAPKYLCFWIYFQKGRQWEHKSSADVESIASWAKMGELWQKQDVSSFVTALMQNQWVSSALLAKLHSRTLLCCCCEIIWGLQNNCKIVVKQCPLIFLCKVSL